MQFSDLTNTSQQIMPGCPICNKKYEVQKIQIIDEVEGRVLSHFQCTHCSSCFLASITETPFGHMAAGLMTDLRADEVVKFAGSEPVSYDDVLDLYELMESEASD